jgi:hypothetical protein
MTAIKAHIKSGGSVIYSDSRIVNRDVVVV